MIPAAKIRYVVATHGRPLRTLGVVLLVVGVVGVAATLMYPPTTTVTEVTDSATVETGTTMRAPVEGEHAMYDDGEVLTDEPVYIRAVAPNLSVTASTRSPPDGVDIEQRLSIVYEASSSADGVFRERRDVLRTTTDRVEQEGQAVNTTVSIEIAEIARTLNTMRDEIGDAGGITAYLHVETVYDGPEYEGTLENRAPLSVSEDAYRLPTTDLRQDHPTTTSVTQPDPRQVFEVPLPELGSVVVPHWTPLFGVLAVLGGLAIGAARYGREFSVTRERATVHRLRYAEWISTGELPATLAAHPFVVPMASLQALVDVAIDSETRVVHDASQDCYAVLTAGALYVFVPDAGSEVDDPAPADA
ncbi:MULTISPECIES: DUF5305 family protein [Halolamina]|uniref:DUF5305 domain-containing protein n=1 Tax=Halolamina pelagica TaxID=699431 RepID=A0A1I5TSW8_9EURY|nr:MULTISPECIES: DUF5305 family protein [Halolamina]NHX37772.1 DUF5305 domain-containing protein [Halolamina sp. R1-12]SFP85426.1 hypothetical protein SAMN05216277_11053 [Halolamina pelagica]